MLGQMTQRQFMEWRAFDEVDPIGGERLEWIARYVLATISNLFTRKAWVAADFVFNYAKDMLARTGAPAAPKKQTWQEQKMLAQILTAAFASDKKKAKPPPKGKKNGR